MASLTTTSYAVLGLLAIKPWTTYELAKQTQRGLGWFWPRAERKLYDEPKRLVEVGYATADEGRTGLRRRTVYTITPAGRRALRAWLGEPPEPPVLEFEAMVKVFYAEHGSREQLRATLAHVGRQAAERLEVFRAMAVESAAGRTAFPDRLHINALGARFWTDYLELLQQWAAWADEQVVQWRSTDDPGSADWQSVWQSVAEGRR